MTNFSFYISSDISIQVQFRADKLLGQIPAYRDIDRSPGGTVRPSSLYLSAQLCDFDDVLGVPLRTHFAEAHLTSCTWDSWISFPVTYKDLSPAAQLALTIYEVREDTRGASVLAGTTLRLFSKHGRLKAGNQVLTLWKGRQADTKFPSTTPGKLPTSQRGQLGKIERAVKRYNNGDLEPIPWLDTLSLAAVQEIQQAHDAAKDPGELKLAIELPSFPLPVVFHSEDATVLATSTTTAPNTVTTTGVPVPTTTAQRPLETGDNNTNNTHTIAWLQDPCVGKEDPAELKARKLARGAGRGPSDGNIRPDSRERARIDAVLASPPGRPLSAEDGELLWRFRRTLASDPRALTRFLKCVDWSDASEAKQAADLMARWVPIGVADALELLSRDHQQVTVREYAVSVLRSTTDDDLLDYLLQLVQALRYEASDESPLAFFIAERAQNSIHIASSFYWYLCAEIQDRTFGNRASHVQGMLLNAIAGHTAIIQSIALQINLVGRMKHLADEASQERGDSRKKEEKLRSMLVPGGPCADLTAFQCPCPLEPTVKLAGLVPAECAVFRSALSPLKLVFHLMAPTEEYSQLSASAAASGRDSGVIGGENTTTSSSVGVLQQQQHADNSNLATDVGAVTSSSLGSQQQPIPSPLRRSVVSTASSIADASTSSHTTAAKTLTMIYKRGDDLRQDQLAVQIIALMDRLLLKEHLDLRMVSYRVLPTSDSDGLMEFVPSEPLSSVYASPQRTIIAFLKKFPENKDSHGPMGLKPEILSNFVRSCAGACVVSYILGVGDRHNDNLLLTRDGRMFHIDFGYILGRDPKVATPPPVKLTREMVDAMGGADSAHYKRFLEYCCEAYNILRKSGNLLLSLLHLMADSSIPDVAGDPEKALLKLQERLRPDLSDEDAARWMQELLARAPGSLMPQIIEMGHGIAQRFR